MSKPRDGAVVDTADPSSVVSVAHLGGAACEPLPTAHLSAVPVGAWAFSTPSDGFTADGKRAVLQSDDKLYVLGISS